MRRDTELLVAQVWVHRHHATCRCAVQTIRQEGPIYLQGSQRGGAEVPLEPEDMTEKHWLGGGEDTAQDNMRVGSVGATTLRPITKGHCMDHPEVMECGGSRGGSGSAKFLATHPVTDLHDGPKT